jgi:lipopolysaccharide transport system ATP-binding protein
MTKVIKAEGLSKAYQLGDFGTGTVSRDLERFWARMRGKEDPFLKIGETNDRTVKSDSDVVWSIKDMNFEIEQGDAVGIIGRNGAGKSTLLKVLSRVTSPTTGSVKIKGRIASLLEVGTGFHPELTGRENIFLNGAILGMRKSEIKRKFDEIVAFAGVERYIDTPVKRYSSGMYVRLAFAVAAHLESEILIVDEVLAVGDAEFQKKCLGKMGDISKGEGRTVLFVSHNMGAVNSLCTSGIYLKNGMIEKRGDIVSVIQHYNSVNQTLSAAAGSASSKPQITQVIIDADEIIKGNLKCTVFFNSPFVIESPNVGVVIKTAFGTPVFGTNFKLHALNHTNTPVQNGQATLFVPDLPLHYGTYLLSAFLGDDQKDFDLKIDYLTFDFFPKNKLLHQYNIEDIGAVQVNADWSLVADHS